MIPRIMLLGLLLAHRRQQEHTSLKIRRSRSIRHGNIFMIVRPIRRRGNALFVTQLQGLDAADDFVHVPSHAGGIVEAEHEFVFGIDDEYRANGEGEVLVVGCARINHSVGGGDGTVLVADDGEFDVDFVFAVGYHVVEPILMRLDRIHAQCRHKTIHRLQMIVLERQSSNLSGTHWRKVGRMTEENGPFALLPLVKGVKVAMRCFHAEIWHDVAQAEATVGGTLGVQGHVGFGTGFHGVHCGHGSIG
mmetsp:Transcript_3703/g.8167  ORF Transcript_3703/g.8167 Transcript_3703/m.8167 type:complete len:248 (+) Transcript_3703:232-975(+)